MPTSRWLRRYAECFDTVELNTTFYRLARPPSVARWVEQTPPDFVFAAKMSRFVTHMKRLTDLPPALERYYAGIAPLVEAGRLGPVVWQLPERFHRDDERLDHALEQLPAGRHCFEFRHPSWFHPDVYGLLRERDVALVLGDTPSRPFQPLDTLTAGWTLIRFHRGARGRRGNYSASELADWAQRIGALSARAEVFAYFNNDWEGFAVRNALALKRLLAAGDRDARRPWC
ncbi:MAG TPA: DUF72 domain-containing protein [Solirubrobacteraceae bacterium]|nr:DUF72 domain-containing protein [Solirubrobacteraceae bacterium]